MGVVDGLYSAGMARHMVWLSGLLTFEQCAEVFERIGGCTVARSSIWRRFAKHGAHLLSQTEHAYSQVSPERTRLEAASTDHAIPKGVSMDGGMVNIRGEGWKEMKVGTIYDVTVQLAKDEHSGDYVELPQAAHIAYRAVLGDVAAFRPALWALAVEGQVPSAQYSSVTADGAEWIWNISADLFPDSTQIVDWYHASAHLSDAAEALFPDNPSQAQRWRIARQDDLFLGHIQAITTPLDKANLADHSQYFHTHQRRMQYQAFRENGLPIGSGTVESGVKQFKSRLTGPGMRWNRPTAQRMLLVRAAVLDHSFDDRWRAAA